MAALKALSDNPNICFNMVCKSVDYLFSFEIFLGGGKISNCIISWSFGVLRDSGSHLILCFNKLTKTELAGESVPVRKGGAQILHYQAGMKSWLSTGSPLILCGAEGCLSL